MERHAKLRTTAGGKYDRTAYTWQGEGYFESRRRAHADTKAGSKDAEIEYHEDSKRELFVGRAQSCATNKDRETLRFHFKASVVLCFARAASSCSSGFSV